MKKIIPTLAILYGFLTYSQDETASILTAIPSFNHALEINDISNTTETTTDEGLAFGILFEKATASYLSKDYKACVLHYEASEKLRYYDPVLEYYAGDSYYQLWKQTATNKYKEKAKKLMKSSKKHGFKYASLFLEKNDF